MNKIVIAIVSFLVLLFVFRKKLSPGLRKGKIEYIGIVYLLTIGLMVDSMINAIVIIFLLLLHFMRNPKIHSGLFLRVILIILYLTLNTLIIFHGKSFYDGQNPYTALIELIVYFLLFIIAKTNNYTNINRQALIDSATVFIISVFLVSLFEVSSIGLSASNRLTSIFNSPNQLGIYSAIILLCRILYGKTSKLPKAIRIAMIALSILLLLLSQSRAAWLGVAACVIYMFIKMDIKRRWRNISLVALGCVFILILFGNQLFASFGGRITSAFTTTDGSTQDRIELAKASLDISKDHFFFGTGLRSFQEMAKKYGYTFNSAAVHQPHNAYLELLQNVGIFGLLGFLSIIIYAYKSRNNKDNRLTLFLILFLTFGILSRLFNDFPTTVWFWVMIGIA